MRIGDKNFMNIQEAVGWLLENNALPFQSSANYIGNTEIAISTLINPSPAKVRVGSIIFFADSKVSTVIGVTSNSFIVSEQYNDLVDDIVYVSNVAINASGHLIITLSNGENIDAGLIKQVSSFTINASQHLIVTYNDGSTTDLGAIFSGNINISGNLSVSGSITGNSIIENMSGYSFTAQPSTTGMTKEDVYAGIVKNGNKLTCVVACNLTRTDTTSNAQHLGVFEVPSSVSDKLYPVQIGSYNYLDVRIVQAAESGWVTKNITVYAQKTASGGIRLSVDSSFLPQLTIGTKYYVRYEVTFLLSENLAS